MSKFSTNRVLSSDSKSASAIAIDKKILDDKNNICENSMSPELFEAYLKEKINLMLNKIEEAHLRVKKFENALEIDDKAANNIEVKMELLNKLHRKPSNQALKQMEFLKEYIPKLRERNNNICKKEQHMLQTIENLCHDEIVACKQKLSQIN